MATIARRAAPIGNPALPPAPGKARLGTAGVLGLLRKLKAAHWVMFPEARERKVRLEAICSRAPKALDRLQGQ